MRAFNAFQAVCMFAGWPFLIGWLGKGPFPYALALMWAAIVAYVIGFVAMVGTVCDAMANEK